MIPFYFKGVGPVTNFSTELIDGEVVVSYDPPLNSENCTLTYEENQTDFDCFQKVITVQAIPSNAAPGEIYSTVVQAG